MIQRNFKLALTAGRTIPLVIPASQYDSGEQWIFTLIDETGAKYAPASGAIIGIKSDKMAILNAGTVDAAGRVVINETEQMTAAVGKNVYEILINDQTHGSANFIVMVEPRPGDNADFSDSDLSLLQQAIDGTSETAIKAGVQEWMDENLTDPTDPIVDASLSLSGAAADAKKTGDEISDLKSAIINNQGMPIAVRRALDTMLQNVAFQNTEIYSDELATFHAWATEIKLLLISVTFEQGNYTIFDTDSLDDLRQFLTVRASYEDGTTTKVTDYTLSGTLQEGVSAVTVSYMDQTKSFNVTVTAFSIPEGYTRYGYITKKTTSSSTVAPSNFIRLNDQTDLQDLSVEMWASVRDASFASNRAVLGVRASSDYYDSCAFYVSSSDKKLFVCWRGVNTTHEADTTLSSKTKVKFINPSTSPYTLRVGNVDDVKEWSDGYTTNPHGFFVLGNVAYNATSSMVMAECWQQGDIILRKENGECVGYYVPTVYDGKIGMYDVISEAFYTASTASAVTISNSGCLYAVGNWS